VFGWIIFRSVGIPSFVSYLHGMCQFDTLRAFYLFFCPTEVFPANIFIIIMLVVEWLQRNKQHGLEMGGGIVRFWYVRWIIYLLLIVSCIFAISFVGKSDFIYFQF
jgi:hypothetical protein